MEPADELAATPDEVRSAVETLTKPQLVKLSLYARTRIATLGRRAETRTEEDLLQEALTATVTGRRSWYKGRVDFVGHLIGAMRSTASNWAQKFDEDAPYLESQLTTTNEEGDQLNPVSNAECQRPRIDRVLEAQQELARIQSLFRDDPNVILVIEGLAEGMTGPQIQTQVGMSENGYNAALKRMRRNLRPKKSTRRAV